MKKPYIKLPIPTEISEDGGASTLFVNKQTVPLDGAINEALAGNYCTGQPTLIRNDFFGLMQSMSDGVRRDGHARQIANFLTVYPVFKGEVDLERGFDPAKNRVIIRARLLNEMELDITNWSFEDVTPGKRSFTLQSAKAGAALGVYEIGKTGNINGKNLPSTSAGEELRIHWEVEGTDKSGDIPAAKLTSDVSRIDIATDALDELKSAEYDGKTIVFTVRGNFSSAKVSVKLKYVASTEPTVSEMSGVFTGDDIVGSVVITANGTNLGPLASGDKATIKCDEYEDFDIAGPKLTVNDEGTQLVATENGLGGPDYGNKEITVVLTKHKNGRAYELTKTFVCAKGD